QQLAHDDALAKRAIDTELANIEALKAQDPERYRGNHALLKLGVRLYGARARRKIAQGLSDTAQQLEAWNKADSATTTKQAQAGPGEEVGAAQKAIIPYPELAAELQAGGKNPNGAE